MEGAEQSHEVPRSSTTETWIKEGAVEHQFQNFIIHSTSGTPGQGQHVEGAEQSHAVPDPYTLQSQELNDDYLVIKTKIMI